MTHSWDQDCREKYQQPQKCRWYHSDGRQWRGTKEPLDESEKGEWKSSRKIQHSEDEDHSIQSHHFMANRRGEVKSVIDFLFLGSKITVGSDCSHEIKRRSLEGKLWQTRQCIKKQRHYSADKGPYSQNYGFSSTHVQMWELDHK